MPPLRTRRPNTITAVVPSFCAAKVATGAPTATAAAKGKEWMPNSSGEYSRTPWKYCVIRNKNPNMLK
ncbi:Uncharacterised protein [Mycobacteroides abscessus subsp. abscessus]|nr:Uncharacterised protein [Mycobacteroides abscessus subsp. abscessus]